MTLESRIIEGIHKLELIAAAGIDVGPLMGRLRYELALIRGPNPAEFHALPPTTDQSHIVDVRPNYDQSDRA